MDYASCLVIPEKKDYVKIIVENGVEIGLQYLLAKYNIELIIMLVCMAVL